MRAASLYVALALFWLLLSGYFTLQLLLAGAISCALTVWWSSRMAIVDAEGQPRRGSLGTLTYLPWLFWQIVLANVAVLRIVWSPRPRIRPHFIRVPHSLGRPLSVVTYANSITLTPGTVTVRVDDDSLLVHALTEEASRDLLSGEMHDRIRRIEEASAS